MDAAVYEKQIEELDYTVIRTVSWWWVPPGFLSKLIQLPSGNVCDRRPLIQSTVSLHQGKSNRKYIRKVRALIKERFKYKIRIPNIGACVVYDNLGLMGAICVRVFMSQLAMRRARDEEFGSGSVARWLGRRPPGPCVYK